MSVSKRINEEKKVKNGDIFSTLSTVKKDKKRIVYFYPVGKLFAKLKLISEALKVRASLPTSC